MYGQKSLAYHAAFMHAVSAHAAAHAADWRRVQPMFRRIFWTFGSEWSLDLRARTHIARRIDLRSKPVDSDISCVASAKRSCTQDKSYHCAFTPCNHRVSRSINNIYIHTSNIYNKTVWKTSSSSNSTCTIVPSSSLHISTKVSSSIHIVICVAKSDARNKAQQICMSNASVIVRGCARVRVQSVYVCASQVYAIKVCAGWWKTSTSRRMNAWKQKLLGTITSIQIQVHAVHLTSTFSTTPLSMPSRPLLFPSLSTSSAITLPAVKTAN